VASISRISLIPNPNSRSLKINTIEQLQNARLRIYNMAGQLLSEFPDTKNMTPIEVDINHRIPGIYFLKVESNGTVFSERFVKQW
jgi:Secretion system C-terminal sorting domain